VTTVDSSDFARAAAALRESGDVGLRRRVGAELRAIGKPVGRAVIADAAPRLPRRGGLSARVAAARVGQTNATTGRSPRVTVNLSTREGYALGPMDRGQLRHPIFGHKKRWVTQRLDPGAFTEPFEEQAPRAQAAMLRALERVAADVRSRT
jgi:hypothetical protein